MSLFKRAWLYITRKKVRSLLLLLVTLLAAAFAMLGLAVKHSADTEAAALRKSLGSSFTVKEDPFAIRDLMANYEDGYVPHEDRPQQLTIEMMDRMTDQVHITHYYTTSTINGVILNLELRPGYRNDVYEEGLKNPDFLRQNSFDLNNFAVRKHQLNLYACNNSAYSEYFRTGAFTLAAGRHITTNDTFKALISADLASRNGLDIGDTFTYELREGVFTFGGDLNKRWGDPFTLEIVGLYNINFKQEASTTTLTTGETLSNMLEFDFAENYIFCDLNAAILTDAVDIAYYRYTVGKDDAFDNARIKNASPDDYAFINATFFVDAPENLNAAIADFKSAGELDWHYFPVVPDDSAYRSVVKPLAALGTFSAILIASVVVGCVVIMILLLNMWVKSRRREMGILLSLGVTRRAIIAQLLLEAALLAVIALAAAAGLSALLAGSVGDVVEKMFSPQVAQEKYAFKIDMFLRPYIDVTSAEPVDLSYRLGVPNILSASAAVLLGTGVGVLAAAWNVLKLNPKHVLTRH